MFKNRGEVPLLMPKINSIFVLILLAAIGLTGLKVFHRAEPVKSQSCIMTEINSLKECWSSQIRAELTRGGIAEGFQAFEKLYQTSPSFKNNCHEVAHKLGASAYPLFMSGKPLDFTSATSYCQYGFYHGFLELFVPHSNTERAADFCHKIDRSLTEKTNNSGYLNACYHGLGHGSVERHNPALYGNPKEMIQRAILICRKISDTAKHLATCGEGLFNAVTETYNDGNITIDEARPYQLCFDLTNDFASSCYAYTTQMLLLHLHGDFAKAADFVAGIPDETSARGAIMLISGTRVHGGPADAKLGEIFASCRILPKTLSTPCLIGYADALRQIGSSGNEYQESLAFCNDPILTNEESNNCNNGFLKLAANFLPPTSIQDACTILNKKYLKQCQLGQL